jgi:hypothetical protein
LCAFRWYLRRSSGARALVNDDQHGSDGCLLVLLDVDLCDDACNGGGDFHDRLVRLELDESLILADLVTDLDQYADDGPRFDAFADFRQLHFGGHE